MAAVAALLSLPSSLTNSYLPIPPLFLIARDGSRSGPRRKRRNGRASAPVVCCHCTTPTSMNNFRRRNLLLSSLSSSFALILPISDLRASVELDEDVKMDLLVDDINAYSFLYPVKLPAKKFAFKWYFLGPTLAGQWAALKRVSASKVGAERLGAFDKVESIALEEYSRRVSAEHKLF